MDRAALDKLTKDGLIELVLALEARHAAEMAALQQRIAELERQIGLRVCMRNNCVFHVSLDT